LHRPEIELLLLDEPTNHLDLPSIVWLQQSIIASGKTVIAVSHDEAFLDAIATHIWEMNADDRTLHVSGSKYSAYKHAKLMALEQQRRAYSEQQKRHTRLTESAEQLRAKAAAGHNYQAKDHDIMQRGFKRNRAGRSGAKASAITKRRDAEEKIQRVVEHVPLCIRLEPVPSGTDSSIILDHVQLGYKTVQLDAESDIKSGSDGTKKLPLPLVSLRIDYGERVAIIGFNAIGKTTLLRTLSNTLEPLSGEVHIGRDLRLGNLMQAHDSLPRDVSPRDFVANIGGNGSDTKLNPLEATKRVIGYGLSRHQAESPIRELNPGARARLLLAYFSIRCVNTVILDEPTNHLDEEAILELTSTLNTYQGTVVVVSHDRSFLNQLKLTKTLRVCTKGIEPVESVDAFVQDIDQVVQHVVQKSFE
jgi:ATPase subunit of ABC transporter with duplicated ATPase domains